MSRKDQTSQKAVQQRRAQANARPMTREQRASEHRHLDEVELHRVIESPTKPRWWQR